MNIAHLLGLLAEAGIRVSLHASDLKTSGAKGALTSKLKMLLVENKTALVEHLRSYSGVSTQQQPALVPRQGEQAAPLSFAQQRLWFVDQLESGSTHYNSLDALPIEGPLDSDAFSTALKNLVLRHHILRTQILLDTNVQVQNVVDDFDTPFRQIDLSQLPEVGKMAEIKALALAEVNIAFDLSCDIMIRVLMLTLSEHSHVALVTTHHIASDAWSRSIVKRDLLALYAATKNEPHISLPPLTLQYADYAQWQRDWLTGDVLEEQLAYWLKRLDDMPLLHSLATDHPRSVHQVGISKQHWQCFSPDAHAKIKSLCAHADVTLFMFMHAAFSAFLARYSDDSDIIVGTAISGRTHRQLESLIGFFVNDLVIRSKIDVHESFADYLSKHKNTVLDAYQHQSVPFEVLVERINPDRSLSQNPLFQIKLDVKNAALPTSGESPIACNQSNIFKELTTQSREDLYLNVSQDHVNLAIAWNYDSSLFDANTVARMADCFAMLLQHICQAPKTKIGELALLNEAQKKNLLENFNANYHQLDSDNTVIELIEQQADKSPQALALVCADERMTYAELNEKSNRLARYLRSLGVKSNTLVALCLGRSLDMVVGILAILKAGGAYVPLDPDYPESRLSFILEDCAADIILTQQELMTELDFGNRKLIPLDSELIDPLTRGFSSAKLARRESAVNLSHLAYAIYTSGSTGQPRAVLVSHANLATSTLARESAYVYRPESYVLLSSYAFDSSVAGIFWTLVSGGKLVIAEVTDGLNPSKFSSILHEQQASHFLTLPAVYLHLLRANIALPASLRQIIVAGEECSPDIPQLHHSRADLADVQLVNEYGPTETSVWASYYDCEHYRDGAVPIGKAAPHVRLYVVNEQTQPTPIGVRGELVIGGLGVSLGYLNQSSLNESQFITDPFSSDANGRLYCSGDYVRWRENGILEFVGRRDDQVKIRGFRVELREVESQLVMHEEIDKAVVLARESDASVQLVAYIVLKTSLDVDVGAAGSDFELENNFEQKRRAVVLRIKETLQKSVPGYMIPTVFVFIDAFTTTPNGKVDKNALPLPSESDLVSEAYIAPKNDSEHTLCQLWQQVLHLEKVGTNDNFFMLGGHSLLAAKLIGLIGQHWEIDLPLRSIFEFPTVSALSEHLKSDSHTGALPPIPVADRKQVLLLSHAQQRLWFIDKLGGGSPQYNVPSGYLIDEVLNLEAFEKALGSLIDRHESLRTSFIERQGQPIQVIQSTFDLPLVLHDLTHLSQDDERVQVDNIIQKEAKSVFDLSKDLMIRVRLVRMSSDRTLVLYTSHHIASDGWSASVIQNEFTILYNAFCSGADNPLPPLPVQYADYAMWQHAWLTDEYVEQELAYWRERLDGIPEVHGLPTDKARGTEQSFEGQVVSQNIDPDTSEQVKNLCKKHEVTLYIFLLTAFSVLLSRYSNESDIVIGSPIAGRLNKNLENLIGFFVNSLTIRMDVSPQQSFSQLLENNKHIILEAFSHQLLPFEAVVEHLRPERNLNRNPLFQITFTVQNNELGPIDKQAQNNAESSQTIGLPKGMKPNVRNDLELHAQETCSGISINWIYDSTLFEHQSIVRMTENLSFLIKNIVRDFNANLLQYRSITDLGFICEREQQLLLEQWSGTAGDNSVDHPLAQCLQTQIEAYVAAKPEATAVEFNHQQLSYAELNSRANKLAHYLQTLGVGRETLVLVCLDRSIDMVVALVGILKAGAAFVPLDPSLPLARRQFICADTDAALTITQMQYQETFVEITKYVLCLDAVFAQAEIEQQGQNNLNLAGQPNDLAYVLYTSGSTGVPKGVMVEHRSLTNLAFNLQAVVDKHSKRDNDRWALNASLSFDASLQAISQLAFGITLVIIAEPLRRDVAALCDFLDDRAISVFDCTPSQLRLMLEHRDQHRLPLLVVGGEKIGEPLWQKLLELDAAGLAKSVNVYGPTEACVDSTLCQISSENPEESLGNYLPNVVGYIVSSIGDRVQLAPAGAEGELYLGGAGIARGYLKRPDLSEASFVVDHPWLEKPIRLYKTGDRVRYDSTGQLHFIARVDEQIKIRGYRIELGDIEANLLRHPSVSQAAVMVTNRGQDNSQLLSYISPTAAYLERFSQQANEQELTKWTEVFEGQYQQTNKAEGSDIDYVGWISSYSGQPIELSQMDEWREGTLQQIYALQPKRVLEIGCGTGILLLGYAGACESVHATDISTRALAGVQHELDQKGWSQVILSLGDAQNLNIPVGQKFDTVIINSVVQYFPNALYLESVIESLLSLVEEGGKILLGDIRNYDLFAPHLVAVEYGQLKQSVSVDTFKNRLQRRMQQESELLLSPTFFTRMTARYATLAKVDIKAKRGLGNNEMLRYRYDVVLTKTCTWAPSEPTEGAPIAWSDFVDYQVAENLIASTSEQTLGLSGIANPRIQAEALIARRLQDWQGGKLIYPHTNSGQLNEDSKAQNYALESLLKFAEQAGYHSALTWSQSEADKLDLIFSRHPSVASAQIQARDQYKATTLTNYPQLNLMGADIAADLKSDIALRLPDYMAPSIYIALQHMPTSHSGKVDKRALPIPTESDLLKEAYVAPISEAEKILCGLWEKLLKISQVGVDDNFFSLGGHSLLATRLISCIRDSLGIELSLATIFEHPTIASLGKKISQKNTMLVLPPIEKIERKNNIPLSAIPLSHAQQRLWFIDLLNHGSLEYNMSNGCMLEGTFDQPAFKEALRLLVDRHEVLRTRFTMTQARPASLSPKMLQCLLTIRICRL